MSAILLVAILSMAMGQWARGADPDPLQDFSVADNNSKIFINGVTSIDPMTATAQHFKTSVLAAPGNTNNAMGSSVTLTTTKELPGVNTQGVVLARTDLAKEGVVPPHNHPRASELVFVVQGSIVVGFVDTNQTLFLETLRQGDVFVFPRALVHFLQNVGPIPAVTISALNSQNPGATLLPDALFASMPAIPSAVLQKSFKISDAEVTKIRNNLLGAMAG